MVTGISAAELSQKYPVLYHMAAVGSWPSITKFGLLSTTALLDLFEISGSQRAMIEESHRPGPITITHEVYGSAVIRDQKPMSDAGLVRALIGGLKPRDWYRLLNSRVFFWLKRERLLRLLGAKAYRDDSHTVLEVDTAALLARHSEHVYLCPLNSGCTKPMPFLRGADTFLRVEHYPFEYRRKRGLDPVVELSVAGGVPDISEFTNRVVEMRGDVEVKQIWP
ncbi:MAG TPA: hypothetical protein VK648_11745 [Gemmatimonadaceae bacterium]|nr:MAG: hypothetical protein DMF56_00085 [Acidobacteriota bacterium]HTD84451.1 hypothetical protein [Gemmatimonadaceae bacterium]